MSYKQVTPYALKQIAKAFDGDTLELSSWQNEIEKLEEFFQEYKAGRDFDSETKQYNLAKVGVQVVKLINAYKKFPQFDDRYKPYLDDVRVVLDIDDVVADFATSFCERFELPTLTYWNARFDMKEKLDEITKDETFYVNLPVKHRPNFIPYAYVSSRSIPVEWTEKFLQLRGLPCRPVHHVPFDTSKIDVLKKIGAELFIDDRFENFQEAQAAGITSFLMDAPHNQHYSVGYKRIYNLDIENILR